MSGKKYGVAWMSDIPGYMKVSFDFVKKGEVIGNNQNDACFSGMFRWQSRIDKKILFDECDGIIMNTFFGDSFGRHDWRKPYIDILLSVLPEITMIDEEKGTFFIPSDIPNLKFNLCTHMLRYLYEMPYVSHNIVSLVNAGVIPPIAFCAGQLGASGHAYACGWTMKSNDPAMSWAMNRIIKTCDFGPSGKSKYSLNNGDMIKSYLLKHLKGVASVRRFSYDYGVSESGDPALFYYDEDLSIPGFAENIDRELNEFLDWHQKNRKKLDVSKKENKK